MLPLVFGFGLTFATAMIVILGDTVLKVAADSGRTVSHPYVIIGCLLYAGSALFWFAALRHVTLAQAGVGYSMLTLLALCAIGAIWFDEPIGLRESAGILCALAAMVLMIRFA